MSLTKIERVGVTPTRSERGDKTQDVYSNPVFSIAHMREMVPIFYEVGRKLRDTFLQKVANGPKEVDVLAWMTRCALELIGRSGLGYSFDTLTENSVPRRYAEAVKKLEQPASGGPSKDIKRMRDIIDVFHETSVEIFESKKKALQVGDEALAAQIGRGKDIIRHTANMVASEEDKLSDKELQGQVTSLTFAATDTTSGVLSRIFHLLALHKDARTRKENGGEDLSYDALVSLPYLDAICRETLRLVMLTLAYRDIVLPLGVPVKGINGKEIDALPVPKGTRVSIFGSNRNPGLGFKFSQLEMKVILVLLLEKIEFSMSDTNIVWQMTPIATPNIDMVSITPTMPMNLSLVDSKGVINYVLFL
ncbi:cytochrome P450 [Phlegmacium glaucopus]|nr:cytochrome P450 [Phlegmacium glaucopus]